MNRPLLDELLAKLSDGDSAAAAEVFTAYAPYLRKVIRRQLPPQARSKLDSVDVLQSAWRDILSGLQRNNWHFTTPGQLHAFLVKVMRNRCIDRVRRLRVPLEHEQPLGDVDGEGLASRRPAPVEVAEADELWQQMLTLSPEHRDLLELKRQGLSNTEVAKKIGLHEGSVRRILRQLAVRLACARPPSAPPSAPSE